MVNKVIIMLSFVLFVKNCAAQNNSRVINIDISGYKKFASNYVIDKYDETAKIPDSIIEKYKQSLVPYLYSREKLSIFSCPIFKFKKGSDFSKITNIIDLIDFSNNYKKQIIYLYKKDSLIAEHVVNPEYEMVKNLKENFDEFNFLNNSLLVYKHEFITGVPFEMTDIYAYKEQLEKKYFTFFLEGIDTHFILKGNTIMAVKIVGKKNARDKRSFTDFLNSLDPVFIEINEYFKTVDLNLIYDKEIAEIINKLKKGKLHKAKKLNVSLKDYEN